MYRINPLKRNVLITTDEVIFHASTEHSLDPRTVQQAIIVAEERVIRPALCFDFYEALRHEKNKLVTDVNKATLEAQVNASINENLAPGESVDPVVLQVGEVVNAAEFLSPANLLLWNEYLWKLTAEVVRFIAIPQNYASFTSAGIVHNRPAVAGLSGEGAVTPDLKTAKWLIDKALQDNIDPLMEAMHVWLCKKGNYSLYCKPCDCNANGIAYARKTDIIFDIYEPDEKTGCGCP